LLPLVPAAVAVLVALPEGSDSNDIVWALVVIPLVGVLGAWPRAAQSMSLGESKSTAWLNALGAAMIGVVIGYFVWWQAVEETCHGRYECPF
jgi:membrane associated rhomboid family serine protease